MMAELAVHDKELNDTVFISFFPLIIRESYDERNFVKKAVNWALRQIGKRNESLHTKALRIAKILSQSADPNARWIGRDAMKDLHSASVKRKFKQKRARAA